MMKRMLLLLLALLMLLAAPAQAESTTESIYLLVLRTEQGEVALGTGVLFGSATTLLTAPACWSEGELYAVGADGQHRVTWKGEVIGAPLVLLGLEGESEAQPLTITRSGEVLAYALLGADRVGGAMMPEVTHARRSVRDGRDAVLLTAEEGMLPGAVMLGADGGLACMVVSSYGEGRGVYEALTNVALYALLEDDGAAQPALSYAPGAPAQPAVTAAPAVETEAAGITENGLVRGFTTSLEKGVLTMDLSPAVSEGMNGVFTAFIVSDVNPYLNFAESDAETAQVQFPVLPGTEVMVWAAYSEDAVSDIIYPDYTPGTYAVVSVPDAGDFTDYDFRNVRISLTPYAGEAPEEFTEFLPQQPLTREALANRDVPLYFQTEDTYAVAEESADHPMLIALCTPEGYYFCYESTYYFSPEFSGCDMWYLDLSPLFADYERFVAEEERWPGGSYQVLYCIDGQIAGEFAFELGE